MKRITTIWLLLGLLLLINACKMTGEENPTVREKPALPGDLPGLLSRMDQGDSLRIACFGNSITFGLIVSDPGPGWIPYPRKLQSLLEERNNNPGIEVLNCGTPGFTASLALQALDTAVLNKNPELCILMLGINDCLSEISPEDFGRQLETLVGQLQNRDIQVLLLSPTPILRRENAALQSFRDQVESVAQRKKCAFLDMHARISNRMEAEHIPPYQILPDEVHFAQDRYGMIAEEIDDWWATITP